MAAALKAVSALRKRQADRDELIRREKFIKWEGKKYAIWRERILWALCAGPAVAATLITGSSAASAAVLTPVSGGNVTFGPHSPSHPNCNRWQLERWNLNGNNTITAVYQV
jgi:hypothetical protein